MRRLLIRALLLAGLVLASWGLFRTVPSLLDADPGYVARSLYIVLLWVFMWAGCAFALVRSFFAASPPKM